MGSIVRPTVTSMKFNEIHVKKKGKNLFMNFMKPRAKRTFRFDEWCSDRCAEEWNLFLRS